MLWVFLNGSPIILWVFIIHAHAPAKVLRYLTFVLGLARIFGLVLVYLYTATVPFLQCCSVRISNFYFFSHHATPRKSLTKD